MHWTVIAEYCACAYVLILLVATMGERNRYMRTDPGFRFSLFITLFAILFHIVSVYTMQGALQMPLAAIRWINALRFFLALLTVTVVAADANALLFEDRTQDVRYKRLRLLLASLYVVAAAAAIVVVKALRIDLAGHNVSRTLSWAVCWFIALNLIVLLTALLLERKRVRHAFARVAVLLPILVIATMVLQLMWPQVWLLGMLAAMTLTVLFIHGQQQKLYTDHLTTLASREMFYKTLERFADRGILFHVVVVSLRDYKSVNIRLGQRVGDDFLRLVGTWMAELDKNAVTCRFSGVEFALIVPDARVDDYEKLIETICERFTRPWDNDSHSLTLRAAVVDIAWPEHASTVNELISSLEYAVRLAKSMEGGGVVRFDKQLRNQVGRRGYVIEQMERALSEDRYFIHFQPIFDCKQKRTVGAEVLCRLKDESGVIMPGEFIPLAEETEVIRDIDRRVLMMACAFFSAHRDCGLKWLSVNISGTEYQSEQTRQWLYDLLGERGLPRGSILFELTERMLVADIDAACVAAEQLRAHGVGLSLDDFGVGYSNLFSVIKIAPECVKIDKSLVDHIETDRHARDMLHSVVDGLGQLGTQILAEGVETAAQMRIVERMGVDLVQGYYHAYPMSGEDLLTFLAAERQDGSRPVT